MTSGCVDAITFISLGQVFAAAMTGNTVLFGLALIHTPGMHALRYVTALGGFVLGNAVAALLCRSIRTQTGWSLKLTSALVAEMGLLVASAVLVDAHHTLSPQLLILLYSAAMGAQGVIARRVGINGMTTTVITSTLTGLIESLTWNVHVTLRKTQTSPAASEEKHVTSWSAIGSWLAVILAYAGGAAVSGALERFSLALDVWLPVAIVWAVIASSIAWQARVRQGVLSQDSVS